jgi:hypothetical protein
MPTPAGPDTNEFRCNACGRYFNTASELASHEVECRLARVTTEAGRRDLEEEDRNPRPKNDHDSVERPFQHGRREEEVKR